MLVLKYYTHIIGEKNTFARVKTFLTLLLNVTKMFFYI